ncbi:hypothetical protein [Variovorax sp. ZT4R33]|uniref:hypothetical protein n=1 Tax=Variovorax sp. ZT4R33 TaxID=3443743 RepID=UPI003F48117A
MRSFFSVADVTTMPQIEGLPAWEGLMRRGIEAAREGRADRAEALYCRALDLAQRLLDAPDAPPASADDRIAALVVSHLNLADLYRDADRMEAGVAQLCTAHRALMALLRDRRAGPALQLAACRHSRETHAALVAHLDEHGAHPAVLAALRAGCMPFPPHGATLH